MTGFGSDVDYVDFFRQQYPALWAKLEEGQFEVCSGSIIGRVHGDKTLFIEIDPGKGCMLAWIWVPEKEHFLGPMHEIWGPLDAATHQACHVLESLLLEDEMSGSVKRFETGAHPVVRMDAKLDGSVPG